jgi:hypothetical protein
MIIFLDEVLKKDLVSPVRSINKTIYDQRNSFSKILANVSTNDNFLSKIVKTITSTD